MTFQERLCNNPKYASYMFYYFTELSQRARKSGPTSSRQRYDVATSYRCRPDVGPTFLAGWVYVVRKQVTLCMKM